ncbi:MAG: hypothetical protein ABR974_05035 [Bacteroidales bacterium]|jgi:hypothetical protein
MKEEEKGHNNGQNFVEIIVNDVHYPIHRGNRTVSEIKIASNVPLVDKLDQVKEGKLVPLDDNGSLVIKGGEEFKSHVPSGGSSR